LGGMSMWAGVETIGSGLSHEARFGWDISAYGR